MRPLIFVTNDDGVAAKGLRYAIKVASKFGRVICVVPEQAHSGMSHSHPQAAVKAAADIKHKHKEVKAKFGVGLF